MRWKRVLLLGVIVASLFWGVKEVEAACVWAGFCGGTCTGGTCSGYSYDTCKCVLNPTNTPVPSCANGSCTTAGSLKCIGSSRYVCNGTCWIFSTNCTYGCSGGSCLPAPTSTPTCARSGESCLSRSCCSSLVCTDIAGYPVCLILPTNTPTPTPTPTIRPTATTAPVVCEGNDNNICDGGSSYCENTCVGIGGYATVACATNDNCGEDLNIFCTNSDPQTYYVGYIYCPGLLSPTPTSYCHPFICYTAPNATYCPGFDPATTCASNGGYGICDNCGGMDCGTCSGVIPTSGPAPTTPPSCVSDCATNPCRNTTCSDSTCLGSCDIYCYGLLSCSDPTFNSLVLKNSLSVTVAPQTGDRNHICQYGFSSTVLNRRAIIEVNVGDPDGYANISTVQLRWNGTVYNMSFVSGVGNSPLYSATVDFGVGQNNSGTYPFEVNIIDANAKTSGWVDTGRNWKVWDCLVPVSGSLYDGSSGQACNTTGFTLLVDASLNFSSLIFDGTTDDVVANVSVPARYGPNALIWSIDYLPIFNGGSVANPDGNLGASGRMTRLIDLGTGTTYCPASTQLDIRNSVSAYSTNPSAQVDFSFIREQEGWFQVAGAGVKSRGELSSGVPVTALPAIRALSISGTNASNGLVSFASFSNINGYNDSSAYGSPNNWWINRNTNSSNNYNYQYFYNTFLVNGGIGVSGANWNAKPSSGVYFVNGDLTINSDFSLAAGETIMVIVRGKITIADSVSLLDGIYIADGGIDVLGESVNQLVINGMLYSRGGIRLARSYVDKGLNNDSPAIKVNYRPDLIFNLPGSLMRVLSGWREE